MFTVRMAGVEPAMGVTDRKLLQLTSERLTVKAEVPAVLATLMVGVTAVVVGEFPGNPGPPD